MPSVTDFSPRVAYPTAAIASGSTTTAEIDLHGGTLLGIQFPAAMTSATVKVSVAPTSGGTFTPAQKDEVGGGDYTITVTAGKYVPLLNANVQRGWRFIKLIGASSEAADRTLTLAVTPA